MTADHAHDSSGYPPSTDGGTGAHGEERAGNYSDWRLIPGGRFGSEASVGMDSLDPESVPSQAVKGRP